ncbi:MAG: trifunctional dihydropteroate synthetase [Bathelium mastoideum]|nr:MAG: trifunctional dihydropteroate synthetase [Bathelium mastoideum]
MNQFHSSATPNSHSAFIAMGSNMGNRVDMIEQACQKLDEHVYIRLVRTSGLWETKPMYVEDQNEFLNGVCEVSNTPSSYDLRLMLIVKISTSLQPGDLLDVLQNIEKDLGRVKLIDKGPRSIDLDILLYDQVQHGSDRLTIPHALMLEREFVLRPLCELIPDTPHPDHPSMPYNSFLARLTENTSSPSMSTFTPMSSTLSPLTALNPSRKTQTMAIINLTPDSFSDGGRNSPTDPASLHSTLLSAINAGATILDLGGQSSRPRAESISAAEEFARVAPALALLRSMPEARHTAISIDTYRSEVARQAVAAGAHFVNDVSAGTLDPDMLSTVAQLGCTVCLMHMRGTPETMMRPEHTRYPDGVVAGVATELLERVRAAEAAGVRRWRIMLDPGLGFAKTSEQSLEVLRNLKVLREWKGLEGLPWLVGPSRKGFVGKALGGRKEPGEREWGTAAAVAACVQGGADVVRVHEVGAMRDVVRVSDAIWRDNAAVAEKMSRDMNGA